MRNPSLYRIGGSALVIGAVLDGVALLIHPPQPMDLTAFAALPHGQWVAAHWLFSVGTVFLVAGLLALARHLFGTNGDGWATIGFGATIVTGALFVAIVAPEIVGFSALAQSGADAGAQHAYNAINLNLMSLVHVAGPLFWLGGACFGLAMMNDGAFPRWLGQLGAALGVVEIASNWLLANSWLGFRVVFLAGFVWLAYTGYTLSKVKVAVTVH